MDRTDVTVQSVTDVGPGTVAIDLEAPADFEALPGQFVLLRATPEDEEIARHYTLSRPPENGTFEITVGVDPEGELGPWLAGLEGGETVAIEGPYGQITYEGDRDVVAIAGGPGVGPAVSIAEAAHDAGHGAVVIYAADDPAHRERLEALAADGADVTLLEAVDESGLEEAIATHLEDGRIYAFGFDGFVTRVADAIDAHGGNPDDARIENFG